MQERRQNIKGIQHIGIPTNNMEQTQEFFLSLGFSCIYSTTIGAGRNVRFFDQSGILIEVYEPENSIAPIGQIDHIAIEVSSIEDAYREALSKGYQPMEGEICFLPFFENGVRFFTLKGPNNEKIEFSQPL